MISLKKPFKFIIYSLMLVVTPLFSQQLSEEDFTKRLDEERGNYSVQNYDQNFLGRPGYVWGIIKSKSDNLIYMASNSGILEYDGVNVRRVMVKEDSSYQSGFGNGLARTFVQMDDGTIYVTGNSKFGRLVKNEFGLVEYEYLLHNLPDSIDYKRQIIWGALEHEGNVIFYAPNFVFSWVGDKFNNV